MTQEECFLLQPDWLRNKLRQIKHVIRLWIPVLSHQSREFGSCPRSWRSEKGGKKEKESSIVLSGSKRWFVFGRQQPVKTLLRVLDLIWGFTFRVACKQFWWVGSPSVTVTDEIQRSQLRLQLVITQSIYTHREKITLQKVFMSRQNEKVNCVHTFYIDNDNLTFCCCIFAPAYCKMSFISSFTLSTINWRDEIHNTGMTVEHRKVGECWAGCVKQDSCPKNPRRGPPRILITSSLGKDTHAHT